MLGRAVPDIAGSASNGLITRCSVPDAKLIDVGELDTSVQVGVQYEAQIAHLRHSRFVALREDKKAKDTGRE